MYKTYIGLPKHVRLRFLGSIATKKRKYTYENGLLVGEPEMLQDVLLRKVWFHICKVTDDCLSELMQLVGDDFLMYYVDGIYLREGRHKKMINRVSKKYSVDFTKERVRSIMRTWDEDAKAFKIVITKYDPSKNVYVPKDFTLKSKRDFIGGEYKKVFAENGISE